LGFLRGNLKGIHRLEHVGVDRRVILKWILERWDRKVLTKFMYMRIGAVEGLFEHGSEFLGSIKLRNFLTSS
jgi:hypothetical protein